MERLCAAAERIVSGATAANAKSSRRVMTGGTGEASQIVSRE
jgi:hypothetical protein